MFNGKIVENFIEKDDCEYLINSVKDIPLWESGGSFWNNRVLNLNTIFNIDKKAASIVALSASKQKELIKVHYELDYDIYPDIVQVIRWFPGMEQPPHSDDMSDSNVEGFEHRLYGSIIYLNDDFSGGRTYYPKLNWVIVPKTGKLAIHPGDSEHLHGVSEIKDSIRYTIASFWTKDKDKAYDYSIYQ